MTPTALALVRSVLCVTLVSGTTACELLRKDKSGRPAPSATWVPTAVPTIAGTAGPPPAVAGNAVDLGVAAYPPGTDARGAAQHDWTASLKPSSYRVRYALGRGEAAASRADYRGYAKKVGFRPIDADRFSWQPPPGCVGDMRCVYAQAELRDRFAVGALSERFQARARQAKIDALQTATLVVSMIQGIRYEVPKEEPFGLLPPALVASEKRGDCDSKALLAHMVLADLGIDSVLISSEAHKHTMLAIALPAQGSSFTWQGRRYAFTEMTAAGSPIGHVNPDLLSPSDWRVVAWSERK
ncbi:MAG: hypothetical protein IT373_36245 [Polyangiaceae bacterium]|nr:hypothetical protein [Polyangiaceae bacterium]